MADKQPYDKGDRTLLPRDEWAAKYRRPTDDSPPDERASLAEAILNSEDFMWLMCGPDPQWVASHADALRPAWRRWKELGQPTPPTPLVDMLRRLTAGEDPDAVFKRYGYERTDGR